MDEKSDLIKSAVLNQKPGIFHLWYIREASKTGYEGKHNTEAEYLSKRQPIKDFKLLLRFFIAFLFKLFQGKHQHKMSDPRFLLGIALRNVTMQQAIQEIENTIEQNLRKKIYFVNPDCLNKTFHDREYHNILLYHSDWIFPDGIGLNLASDMLHYPREENVNGTDMLPRLMKLCSEQRFSVFLLGAKPGVAEKMKDRLQANSSYPNLQISGTHHGYFDYQKESHQLIKKINETKADILFVAFGAPSQEKWIHDHFHELTCSIVMGVGGLFDFYSGTIRRAPRWMRDIGLEWCYRLLQEPKRMWKRYLIGNPLFIHRIRKVVSSAEEVALLIHQFQQNHQEKLILFSEAQNDPRFHKRKDFQSVPCYLVDVLPRLMESISALNIPIKIQLPDLSRAFSMERKWKQIYPNITFSDAAKIIFFSLEDSSDENILTNLTNILKNHFVLCERNLVEKFRKVEVKSVLEQRRI